MRREISLSDVERQSNTMPIFALNSASESPVGQPSDIVIGIPKQNGTKADILKIAQTWLPIELTSQIPRAQLLSSSEFRKAINSNLITLISEEYAQLLNKQKGASLEKERIAAEQAAVRAAAASRSISSEVNLISSGGVDGGDSQLANQQLRLTESSKGEENSSGGITPSFRMWAERLVEKSDLAALNEMRSKGKFSRSQLRHMKEVLTNHPETIARIKQVLAKS